MITPRDLVPDNQRRERVPLRPPDTAPIEQVKRALSRRYAIDGELGEGGMAVVYRAHDREHDRMVALKVLRPEMTAALGAARFLREIEIERRLDHPNILPMLDWGWVGGSLYYSMPCVDGETLCDRLRRERQLSFEDAIAIAGDVASALDYAHAEGVIHRDVKPANILLCSTAALVADFGIARAVTAASNESITGSGVGLGTPEYMSPEQGNAASTVEASTDIYALGCVLYEMLAGEPPFPGATVQVVMARHAKAPPPVVRTVRPLLPASVDVAIHRALAKNPAHRFQSAAEFIAAAAAGAKDTDPEPDVSRGAAQRREQMAWFRWPFK